MSKITAALVKELRGRSGAGMMDCKKALSENHGDIEASIDWLRTKGLAAAAKKSSRVAAEGLVALATAGTVGAVIELNSETDFVARNPEFQAFAGSIAIAALDQEGNFTATESATLDNGKSVKESVIEMIGTIGENLTFRRSAGVRVGSGVVSSYVHSAAAKNMGKIGVLVGLESNGDTTKLDEFGKQLAMHIAAAQPQWLSQDDIEPAIIEREREVLAEQARESGKPEDIVQKMVDGRMRKYFEEVCLLEQTFVIDGESKVEKAIKTAGVDVGGDISVTSFVRFHIGEGVEKEDTDFAAEVAATAGG